MIFSNKYNRTFLKHHYESIFNANREIILEGGNGRVDYTDYVENKAMSLVALIRISPEVSSKIALFEDNLKYLEPDMYFYPQTDFHITALDILKGKAGREIPENISDYIDAISSCTTGIKPFEIELEGVSASDNAVMVCGYYEESLEILRNRMRSEIRKRQLPLDERYETFSSHITIARLCSKYNNPQKLISLISEPRYFGVMTVNSIEISFHSWCDSQKTVLANIVL